MILVPETIVSLAKDDTIGGGNNIVAGASVNILKVSGGAATIYSDAAGTTTITLPTVTDSNGELKFFIARGEYNYVIAGVTYRKDVIGAVNQGDVIDTWAAIATVTPNAAGQLFTLKQHTSGGLGGGALMAFAGSVADDGGSKKNCLGGFYLKRVHYDTLTAFDFGAVKDSSTDVTVILQKFADFCSDSGEPFVLKNDENPLQEYLISAPIVFTGNVSVFGIGSLRPRILCDDCDAFAWPAGATEVIVDNIRMAQSVRHTTTPNTRIALYFAGSTGARPYYNRVRNVFIDGFGVPIHVQWLWNTIFTECETVFCGKAIYAEGICVNNTVTSNNFEGNGIGIDLGDGTNTIEGWLINDNLIDGFVTAFDGLGASYCQIKGNIIDHIGTAGTGVLFRSAASLPSIGNLIQDNYLAFSNGGSEGIRLLNNLSAASNMGSVIACNEIIAYSGSLTRGILIDGTQETGNIISDNNIKATTYDCDISGALSTVVTGNTFAGGGFLCTTPTEYSGNTGSIVSSQELLKRTVATISYYYASSIPTSGTYKIGDEVKKINPSINGNNMILMGWIRLTNGSAHVSGTDWGLMYVSHVTPAA